MKKRESEGGSAKRTPRITKKKDSIIRVSVYREGRGVEGLVLQSLESVGSGSERGGMEEGLYLMRGDVHDGGRVS